MPTIPQLRHKRCALRFITRFQRGPDYAALNLPMIGAANPRRKIESGDRADQFAETLAAAGVKRIYGIVGDSLNGLTDCAAPPGQDRVGACPARGGRRLRGRRRGASDRRARRLRRQLRARQSASHQRPVRLPPLARAGAGDRGADPFGRDRLAAISRKPTRRRCSTNAATIASWSPAPSRCRARSRSRSARRSASAACRCVVIPGDVALQPAVRCAAGQGRGSAAGRAGRDAARMTDLDRLAALLNGESRVTMLCGSGCQGAHDELLALGRAPQGADRACACAARSMSNGTIPTTSA